VLTVIAESPGTRWLIVDGAPIVHLDSTGADTIAVLADEVAAQGVRLERLGAGAVFPTLRSAMEAYQSRERPAFALSETAP
jgi:hypothetical protein